MNNKDVFFELVKGGLWETEARLVRFGSIDFASLMQLAEEQSVTGLITAGLEQVKDVKVPQEWTLQFIGRTLQMEQRNKVMNQFLNVLYNKLSKVNVVSVLVKGQGVAQCYERPHWRASGDIDLYLSESNYESAKEYLKPLAKQFDKEDPKRLHFCMTIDPWVVELHGTMHSDFSKRMNRGLDEVHHSIFYEGSVRSWNNDGFLIFMPSANNDVIIVFTHFIQLFFVGGIGLRQICDWCRLLWVYRSEIDRKLLEKRLRSMGLMTEWRAFAAFAVNNLGMPKEAMPFYECSRNYDNKANRIGRLIMQVGNMGHNRDASYRSKYSLTVGKFIKLWKRLGEFFRVVTIFPCNAPKFFVGYLFCKV